MVSRSEACRRFSFSCKKNVRSEAESSSPRWCRLLAGSFLFYAVGDCCLLDKMAGDTAWSRCSLPVKIDAETIWSRAWRWGERRILGGLLYAYGNKDALPVQSIPPSLQDFLWLEETRTKGMMSQRNSPLSMSCICAKSEGENMCIYVYKTVSYCCNFTTFFYMVI